MLSSHNNGNKPFNILPKPSNAIPTIMSSGPIVLDHIATFPNMKKPWKMPKNVSPSILHLSGDIKERELLFFILVKSIKLSTHTKRDLKLIQTMPHYKMI
jgi:hypothetical protein